MTAVGRGGEELWDLLLVGGVCWRPLLLGVLRDRILVIVLNQIRTVRNRGTTGLCAK